jgi:hypothetical protein
MKKKILKRNLSIFAILIMIGILFIYIINTSNNNDDLPQLNPIKGGASPPFFVYNSKESLKAYRIATAIPEILEKIPCYCSCFRINHISVKNCFIKPNGEYSPHGSNCTICMHIVMDVYKMYKKGVNIRDIRNNIDLYYARYGEPTPTPLPY